MKFKHTPFGWICLQCSETNRGRVGSGQARARFFSEGEAEEKGPVISTTGLAHWRDDSRQFLYCPVCLAEERVSEP